MARTVNEMPVQNKRKGNRSRHLPLSQRLQARSNRGALYHRPRRLSCQAVHARHRQGKWSSLTFTLGEIRVQ